MVEDVIDAGHHLVLGQGHGIDRVQDGEPGHDFFIGKYLAHLQLLFRIGDDGPGIHFRAGPHHGEYRPHGDGFTGGFFESHEIFFPGVLVTVHGNGQGLGIVDDGTAAHGQDEVRTMLPGNGDAFPQLVDGGVGHDTGDFGHVFAGFCQNLCHRIIDTVLFDGTAPVNQDHLLAILGQFSRQVLQGILPEIQFRGIAVGEIS